MMRDEEVLAGLVLRAEQHVLHDGQARQRLGQLEGAHHADAGDLGGADVAHRLAVEDPLGRVALRLNVVGADGPCRIR